MKIQSSADILPFPEATGRATRGENAAAATPEAAAQGAAPSAEPRLSLAAEFDAAKVQAIKQAMREGRFQVNADAVADRLLESVRELLAPGT